MKQKSGGIKRLLEFTGEKRSLLNISRILSGVSAIFILGPFLCVYFAARELVNVFTDCMAYRYFRLLKLQVVEKKYVVVHPEHSF